MTGPTLNDTHEQLCAFDRALSEFNEMLGASTADLRKSDARIAALWRDTGSDTYRRTYDPLAESLDRYLRSDAPRFEHFIKTKIRQLGIFLHGDY
jgi:hypothetical protein